MRNRWCAALVAQAVLAVYFSAVEWISLPPWNNVANGNGQERLDVVAAILQSAIFLAFFYRFRLGMWAGCAVFGLWLLAQVVNWWLPYFFGAPDELMAAYNRYFLTTYKFLPPWNGGFIPDANHVVLQLLISCALLTSVREAARTR